MKRIPLTHLFTCNRRSKKVKQVKRKEGDTRIESLYKKRIKRKLRRRKRAFSLLKNKPNHDKTPWLGNVEKVIVATERVNTM